jgi:CubicO group peptidase (beta-lactamase class C family)
LKALDLTALWPVTHVSAAAVLSDGSEYTIGDVHRSFRLASVTKMLTGWATLIACEEGIVDLDQPVGQPGCTLRHLLAHAGGYAFDGAAPIATPGQRRIYSNTGIELVADAVEAAAEMRFQQYLQEAVFQPLGMHGSALTGSASHGVTSTVHDLLAFVREVRAPELLAHESAAAFSSVQFPELSGVVPGVGSFRPCPWGLGTEIRGDKQPHWMGTRNSPSTYGHFGGAGTFLCVDPGAEVAVVALTDRPFDEWSAQALVQWPALIDAVLVEASIR